MEESQKVKTTSEHKRSIILFWIAVFGTVGVFIALGGILIATGELKESMHLSKTTDSSLLAQITSANTRLTSIEIHQEKNAVVDSVFRADAKKEFEALRKDNKNLQTRMIRLEWKNQLPPIEPSYNEHINKFNDLSDYLLTCPK